MMLVVLGILKSFCSGSLWCVCGLISLSSLAVSYGFNLWGVTSVVLSIVVVYNFLQFFSYFYPCTWSVLRLIS